MFEGMRNLESQSSGGKPGATESGGCALQGSVKGNTRGDFDLVLRDPTGRWGDVGGPCWSPLPARSRVMPDQKAEGTAGWDIHPRAGARLQLAFPWSFFGVVHLHSSSPGNPAFTHRCRDTQWLKSLVTLTTAEVLWPDQSLNRPGLQKLLCALCRNKRNSLKG